jgi:hypothetical protein
VNDETLGETLLQVTTMVLIAIILALIVMGALGMSLAPMPEHAKPSRSAVVQVTPAPKDHPKHSVGPNP